MHPHPHPHAHQHAATHGFGSDRAPHYDAQVTAHFAGYVAMHEQIATAMASVLTGRDAASVLCVGLGTGHELLAYNEYGAPGWRFTGVDPSAPMLAVAEQRLATAGLLARTRLQVGEVRDLPPEPRFDGAQMIGVLHHVSGDEARLALLGEVVRRLQPGAPFIIGCRVGLDPVLLAVEEERFRVKGGLPAQGDARRQALATLGVPPNDAALFALLDQAGLREPKLLFATLQFKVFLTHRD